MKLNKKYFPAPSTILVGLFCIAVTAALYNTKPPVFFRPYLSWAGPLSGIIFGWGWVAALVIVAAGSFWSLIKYDEWRRDR